MKGMMVRSLCVIAMAGLLVCVSRAAQAQGQVSTSEIVDALHRRAPQGLTRSLVRPKAASADQQFLDSLRSNGSSRSLSVEERTHVAEIVKDRPSKDLEITFDFDSVEIGSQAMPILVALGTALRSPELTDQSFLVAGHTDMQGGDAYNRALSERRAEAVKRFLVQKFQIPAQNLISVGFGKEQPKNSSDPTAAENRRVQVVNLSAP